MPNIPSTPNFPVMIETVHDPDDDEYAAWNRAKQMYARKGDSSETEKRGSRGSASSFGESDSMVRRAQELAVQSNQVLASPMTARYDRQTF